MSLGWFKVRNGNIAILVSQESFSPAILPLIHDANEVTLTEVDVILLRASVVVDCSHQLTLWLFTAAAAARTCCTTR